MNQRLANIAKAVRAEMHNFQQSHPNVGCGAYPQDTLAGYCAISSYLLVTVARRLGFKIDMVVGRANIDLGHDRSNHAWTEYENEIYDLTATQFWKTVKPVHIVKATNRNYKVIVKNKDAHDELKDRWGSQSPYAYVGTLRYRARKIAKQLRNERPTI